MNVPPQIPESKETEPVYTAEMEEYLKPQKASGCVGTVFLLGIIVLVIIMMQGKMKPFPSGAKYLSNKKEISGIWVGTATSKEFGSGVAVAEFSGSNAIGDSGSWSLTAEVDSGYQWSEEGTYKVENGQIALYKGSHLVNYLTLKKDVLSGGGLSLERYK